MKGLPALLVAIAMCMSTSVCLVWQLLEFANRWGVVLHTQLCEAVEPAVGQRRTQLAHLGYIDTADGRFEVVVQRTVPISAASPKGGDSELLLVDRRCKIVWRHPFSYGEPLWCERGKIYWCGSTNIGLPIDPGLAAQFPPGARPRGNVLDFDDGIAHAFVTEELRYGSIGGLVDEYNMRLRRR